MSKYIFIENGMPNGAGEVKQLDENILNIQIDDKTYFEYISNPTKFIFDDGQIIQNPQYLAIKHTNNIKNKINEIVEQLEELDKKRIRAICENEVKDKTTGETWLEYYNSQILELRKQIINLNSQL